MIKLIAEQLIVRMIGFVLVVSLVVTTLYMKEYVDVSISLLILWSFIEVYLMHRQHSYMYSFYKRSDGFRESSLSMLGIMDKTVNSMEEQREKHIDCTTTSEALTNVLEVINRELMVLADKMKGEEDVK